jgi:hypothetical protein
MLTCDCYLQSRFLPQRRWHELLVTPEGRPRRCQHGGMHQRGRHNALACTDSVYAPCAGSRPHWQGFLPSDLCTVLCPCLPALSFPSYHDDDTASYMLCLALVSLLTSDPSRVLSSDCSFFTTTTTATTLLMVPEGCLRPCNHGRMRQLGQHTHWPVCPTRTNCPFHFSLSFSGPNPRIQSCCPGVQGTARVGGKECGRSGTVASER